MRISEFAKPVVVAAALLLAGLTSPLPGQPATGARSGVWAHDQFRSAPDARVTWGRLENGFRYALLPHHGVAGRVAMRLLVLSGSLDETESELGMAHFLEHLSFRSSRRLSAEDKVAFFQRLGMEAGSDVNAVTTFDYTEYMLDFRENSADLLRGGLLLFSDIAGGVTFIPAEIDKERGVILSEMRGRSGLAEKQTFASYGVLFKGLRFPGRMPIGTEESVRSFTAEQFQRFYARCYRPDLMVLIASGDFEPADFSKLVAEYFSPIPRPTTPVPVRDEGRLDSTRALRADIYRASTLGAVTAIVGCVSPPLARAGLREAEIEDTRRSFAMDLFSERLRTATDGSGSAGYENMLGNEFAYATASMPGAAWQIGVGVIDDLVRFTHQRGFEQREIDTIKRRYLTLADHMLDQRDTLDPAFLCQSLTDSITENSVYAGFEQHYRWLEEAVAKITPREVQQSFQALWDPERMAFHLAGEMDLEGGGAEIVKQVLADRRSGMRHFRPDTRKESTFAVKQWGQPTAVVERSAVPELNAQLVRFGNNVRLNFVPSRTEPGLVYAVVRVGSGLLEMPGDRPALKEFGLQTLLASGTTHFTTEQIGDIIEDRLLAFSLDVDDHDAFSFRGTMGTEKLETFLGLVTEYLYRPLFETMTHREERMKAFINRGMSTLGMQEGMRKLDDYLFRGDPRFTWGTPNDYIGLSTVDVRDWLQEPLAHGYVEATIVGDFSEENLLRIAARTLGSLPRRAENKSLLLKPKPVAVTAPAGFQRIEFVGEQHLAGVFGTWPVVGALSTRDRAALHVLTKALEERINAQIRNELGLAYSPDTEFSVFDGFGPLAVIQANVDCAPSEATRIAGLVEEIAAQISVEGVSEGEFIGARGILKGQLHDAFLDDSFLVAMLMRAQEQPDSVQQALELRHGLIETVTIDEVNAWAKKILPASNSRTAAVVPKPFIGIFQPSGP